MLFLTTLQQMAFLFSLIAIGYILMKFKFIPENSETVLSKLENYLFIPGLVLGTFISNFTVEKLASSGKLLIGSIIVELIVIPISFICVRLISKDEYIGKIYLYGLCFSNFGFMGNAIVKELFPNIFLEYIVFTLVLWALIYLWGAPSLLVADETKKGIKNRLKSFLNPMFVCTVLGIIIGLSGIRVPSFAENLIDSLGNCMSPVAMLITGMTIAKIDLRAVLKIKSIYIVTALRLLVFPLIFIAFCAIIGKYFSDTFIICATAALAMPLGLNTIVIPSAYGKDSTVASGMAIISHTISIATIPIVFLVLEKVM